MKYNFIKRFFIVSLAISLCFSNICTPQKVYATDLENNYEVVEDYTEDDDNSEDEDSENSEDVKEEIPKEESEGEYEEESKEESKEDKDSEDKKEIEYTSINIKFIIDDDVYKEIYNENIDKNDLEDGLEIDYVEPIEKKGYKFIGWSNYKDSYDSFDFKVYGSETINVYAIYEKMTATVKFVNTPVAIEPVEVDLSGDSLKISEVDDRYTYKNYYNFLGFTTTETYSKETLFDFNSDITKDLTLYAQYSPVNFTIIYKINVNGQEKKIEDFKSLVNPNRTSYTVETGKFKLQDPSIDGYIFLGWSNDSLKKITKDVNVSIDTRGALVYTMNFISGEGLYDSDFKKVKSFDKLLDEKVLTLKDGVLSGGFEKIERVNNGKVVTDDFGEPIIDKVINASNDSLTGILVLPEDGIEKIEEDTFSLLDNLDAVYISDSVKELGDRSFKDSSVSKIVFMGDGLETVGDEAFSGCENLEELNLPDSVSSFGEKMLEDVKLMEIYIPKNLDNINTDILPTSLTRINVSEDNKKYKDIDGVLVSKDNKTLIKYPSGRVDNEYKIPASIETVAKNAFSETSLEKIDLGNVSVLEDYAFSDSSNLRVVLNDNLKEVSDNSLDEIREVYYSGDNEELLNKSFGAKKVGENHKIIYNVGNSENVINNNKEYFHEFEEFYINEPSRSGYTFIGWVYDNFSNPIKNFKVDKFNDEDITLRAVWATKGSTYSVVFDRNYGGDDYTPVTQEFIYLDDNNSTVFKLYKNSYKRDGYTFKGWSLTRDGAVDFEDNQRILENLTDRDKKCTLYAIWEINTFSINYGPVENNKNKTTYTVNDEFKLEAPERYGYKFMGWIGSCGQVPVKNVTIKKGTTGDKTYLPVYVKI